MHAFFSIEPFDIRTRTEDVWKGTLDGWCRGKEWAVDGLDILRVNNNMCGAVGVSDCEKFARYLYIKGSFWHSPMGYDVLSISMIPAS